MQGRPYFLTIHLKAGKDIREGSFEASAGFRRGTDPSSFAFDCTTEHFSRIGSFKENLIDYFVFGYFFQSWQ